MNKQSREDYLRALYHLWEENRLIRSKNIASYLKVSKPSVSIMLKKFVSLGYIKKSPYGQIELTKSGKKRAEEITKRHRLIEVFLKNILRIKNKEIHKESHKLEHAFSESSIKKLEKFLKNPQKCPHGKIIPR